MPWLLCRVLKDLSNLWNPTLICFFIIREIEYLKKETQRCAQVGAEASALTEESGELQEQVDEASATVLQDNQ